MKEYRIAVILWIIFLITVCSIIAFTVGIHTNTPFYMLGTLRWIHGVNLYTHTGQGFIYLPQAAIFFIPFNYLAVHSFLLAEIFWRILTISFYVYGLYRFTNLIGKNANVAFLICTIVSIFVSFSVFRNGQFSAIIMTFMMLSLVSIAKEKWWQATILLVLGLAIKPTMIVLLLLVWVLYPRLWWRIPLGLLGIFLVPFLLQNPHYVLQQYLNSITMLNEVANVGSVETNWAQIFGLLAEVKIILARNLQDIIRLIFAIITLIGCFWIKQKFSKEKTVIFIYTLAIIYLMLFNPRTENTDYGMLAPALGIFLSQAYISRRRFQMVVLVILTIGISGCYYFSHLITPDAGYWFAPLTTILFTGIIFYDLI